MIRLLLDRQAGTADAQDRGAGFQRRGDKRVEQGIDGREDRGGHGRSL
jgi:hypothetical protein